MCVVMLIQKICNYLIAKQLQRQNCNDLIIIFLKNILYIYLTFHLNMNDCKDDNLIQTVSM